VCNLLISQYPTHLLKSKLADGLAGWWVLSQNRDYDSSSFTFGRHGQKFKVSSFVGESTHMTFMFDSTISIMNYGSNCYNRRRKLGFSIS
jgi:hypothetical protein